MAIRVLTRGLVRLVLLVGGACSERREEGGRDPRCGDDAFASFCDGNVHVSCMDGVPFDELDCEANGAVCSAPISMCYRQCAPTGEYCLDSVTRRTCYASRGASDEACGKGRRCVEDAWSGEREDNMSPGQLYATCAIGDRERRCLESSSFCEGTVYVQCYGAYRESEFDCTTDHGKVCVEEADRATCARPVP
jgi:hypothetical protein